MSLVGFYFKMSYSNLCTGSANVIQTCLLVCMRVVTPKNNNQIPEMCKKTIQRLRNTGRVNPTYEGSGQERQQHILNGEKQGQTLT